MEINNNIMILLLTDGKIDPLALLFLGIIALLVGPPLIMIIVGLVKFKKNRKLSMWLFSIAVIYMLIGLGWCASMQ